MTPEERAKRIQEVFGISQFAFIASVSQQIEEAATEAQAAESAKAKARLAWYEEQCGLLNDELDRLTKAKAVAFEPRSVGNDLSGIAIGHIQSPEDVQELARLTEANERLQAKCAETLSVLDALYSYFPHEQYSLPVVLERKFNGVHVANPGVPLLDELQALRRVRDAADLHLLRPLNGTFEQGLREALAECPKAKA